MRKISFTGIQQLGRALMLPIAVLPVAALFLRFGQDDLLNLPFVANAGAAIFDNLGILFAIGIAVGFAKENNGAAGLAGAVGYYIVTKGASTLLVVPPDIIDAAARVVYTGKEISRMSVPIGILAGLTAGLLYNKYHAIKLPDYLSFFGGRRFVPIITGCVCLLWAVLFGLAWTPLTLGLDTFSELLSSSGKIGLFIYGTLNRLLIVTGLHHILNNVVWFVHGTYEYFNPITQLTETARGDLSRFFAGDPDSGVFMAGFFPVMMFGLPAACLAMYRNALPQNRQAAGGILLSMALTSFLTGITEPIEFAFMFLAPVLYAIHAVLTGLSAVVMDVLNVKLGFGFSAGLIDYVINFNKETNPLLLLPIGAAYFAVYFLLFDLVIRKFDLKTIGRESMTTFGGGSDLKADEKTLAMIRALGGGANLQTVDACTTRLRLKVGDNTVVDEKTLRDLGARGFVRPDSTTLQVILGPIADTVASDIRAALREGGDGGDRAVPAMSAPASSLAGISPGKDVTAAENGRAGDGASIDPTRTNAVLAALGGVANIRSVKVEMITRLRVILDDSTKMDRQALAAAGIPGVMPLSSGAIHLIVGKEADAMAASMYEHLG